MTDIETQYAGAILMDPSLYWRDQVPPEDIENGLARKVVTTVADMLREGVAVDVVSVSDRAGLPLTTVGGLTQDVHSPVGAASAAAVIRRDAYHRRAKAELRGALDAIDEGADPRGVLANVQERLADPVVEGSANMLDALADFDERTEKPAKLVTQIPRLNELLPIDGGKLVVIAGRPGTFKSALALHIARYSAMRNMGVGIISLEMPRHEIAGRYKLLTDNDRTPVPIMLNCAAQDLNAIETQIIQWVERDGLNGVVVDYLTLVTCQAPKTMRRDEVIGLITRRLKLLAMRLDIPILLLAQLNREPEKHNRKPMLSDLRESGNVEQDADVVLFTYKREVDGRDEYELIIAKHRGGPVGYIDLHIDAPKYRVLEALR